MKLGVFMLWTEMREPRQYLAPVSSDGLKDADSTRSTVAAEVPPAVASNPGRPVKKARAAAPKKRRATPIVDEITAT